MIAICSQTSLRSSASPSGATAHCRARWLAAIVAVGLSPAAMGATATTAVAPLPAPAAAAAPGSVPASASAPAPASESASLEQIVVTATRLPVRASTLPLSLDAVDGGTIRLVSPTHHVETLNRVAGVMIQRGSGQESLTAIRSPVLTGAGSCGAFLFLENSVPIRPVGFCNVNELLEVNTEQAAAIEVLRGPGTALYGSNAVHGIVNVRQPDADGRPALALGLDAGPADYGRARFEARAGRDDARLGAAGFYAHDGGWRDESGYDEAKLNLVADGTLGGTAARGDFAATTLDQETAGFVTGKGAYRDGALRETNPNPEAYREAHALRLTGLLEPPLAGGTRLELRPYLRSSRMEFLQHFLLGQPLERNGQESGGLMSALVWDADPDGRVVAGLDLELADSFLLQRQDGPTTGGAPGANAIRPAGLHYDYDVASQVAAGYVHGERRFAGRWRASAGLRAEWVRYDYDNRMLDGNTDENGVPCTPTGCLYSRPADRTDTFVDLAPKLALAVDLAEGLLAYANASVGFRPPEMTELYRLQRTQRVAELDSERIDALELGLKAAYPTWSAEAALFDMDKRDLILRESNGFNVSGGRTSHRGVEYTLRWRPASPLELAVAGTYARHRYEFTRAVEGGERIVAGNDVDTAPRSVYRASIAWQPRPGIATEAEWLAVGDYWLDAANEHRYDGHGLLNLRARWQLGSRWSAALRLNNALDRWYADRADFAFGTYRYFPGRGRALFAELSWSRE
jgi:outer membrane receptor protein involved in Fe transport